MNQASETHRAIQTRARKSAIQSLSARSLVAIHRHFPDRNNRQSPLNPQTFSIFAFDKAMPSPRLIHLAKTATHLCVWESCQIPAGQQSFL